jgi:hypothetical protein
MEALKKTSIPGEMSACLSGNYIVHLKEIHRGFGLDSHLWERNRIVCRRP